MTTVPVTENAARRRIGDILLDLGFASEEALAEASAEQERTGQPLGQILVEHGAITRLELASALAEQWSDQSASISLLPVPKPASARPVTQHHHDDEYAARLQDAVADLARRVQATSNHPSDGQEDARVTELAERLEATVARAQRIEATLATLAESLEGVTGGVEEAFTGLQAGMAGLALDLARVDSTVAEIVAHPVEVPLPDPALAEQLEELGATVQALGERPLADPDARDRLDTLAAELERFAESEQLETLRGTLGEIERRVGELGSNDAVAVELESQRATLADLRSAVADLTARPESSPELDDRLARIEAALAEGLASSSAAGAVEALAGRIESAIAEQQGLAESVEAIQDRLEKPAELVAELAERVEELGRERDAQLSLAARVEALEVPVPALGPDPRIDELGHELAALREELHNRGAVTPADLGPLEHRLSQLAEHVEQLGHEREAQLALAARVEALEVPAPALGPDPRIDELGHELAALREELHNRGAVTPADLDPLEHRLSQLAEHVEQLGHEREAQLALAARVEALEVPAPALGPDLRIDELGHELAALREELHNRGAVTPADLDPLEHRLSQLAEHVEQLGHEREAQLALAARVEALEVPAPAPQPDSRLDWLAEQLDVLHAELAARDAAPAPEPTPDPRIDELSYELATLRQELTQRVAAATSELDPALGHELSHLAERVEQLARDSKLQSALAEDIHALEGRLRAEIVTPDVLAEALDRAREELRPPIPEPDPRVDGLVHDIAALRHELSQPVEAPPADPEIGAALGTLLARMEAVENRLANEVATPAAIAQAVDKVRAEVAGAAPPPPPGTSGLEQALGAMAERVNGLESMAARLDGLAETVAAAAREGTAAPVVEDLRQDIEARVAQHMTGLKEALQHELESMLREIEQPVRVTGGESLEGFEDDMERTRMAIERLSLHLGEHDRALTEMTRGRGIQQKVDDLAARIDELAAGGVVAPADGAPAGSTSAAARRDFADVSDIRSLARRIEGIEEDTHEGREKLMNRLERMASSIDWRLQRLETGETGSGS